MGANQEAMFKSRCNSFGCCKLLQTEVMAILMVKMALITNLVLLIVCVQPVVANSTVGTSTGNTSTAASVSTESPSTTNGTSSNVNETVAPAMTSTTNGTSSNVNETVAPAMTSTTTATLVSTEPPSTTNVTDPPVNETNTPAMTPIATVTSSMPSSSSSSTPEGTTPQSTAMTATPSVTTPATIMTSNMLSSPPTTTPMNTVSPMETTMSPSDTSPTMATAGRGQVVIIVISTGVGVLLLVLAVIAAFCIYRKRYSGNGADTRPLSLTDEDGFSARMSVHRPDSSHMNADGDLAFLTFTGKHNDVDGIVNPTYDTTVIDEIPTDNDGGGKDKTYATVGGSATIPSTARLPQNSDEGRDGGAPVGTKDNEGAVEGAVDASETGEEDGDSKPPARNKEGEMRPISGVSYKSADIDFALEVLDVGTV